jgi:hypothetical protein
MIPKKLKTYRVLILYSEVGFGEDGLKFIAGFCDIFLWLLRVINSVDDFLRSYPLL